MPKPLSELAIALREYKNADLALRRGIINSLIGEIERLPSPEGFIDASDRSQVFKKMAHIATILHYAAVLQRTNNQILIDFKMPKKFESNFAILNDYFEFIPAKHEMRLKQPISAIRPAIWELFQLAQENALQKMTTEKTPEHYKIAYHELLGGARKVLNPLDSIDKAIQQSQEIEGEYHDAYSQLTAKYIELEENTGKKVQLYKLLVQIQRLKNSNEEDTDTPQLTGILNQTCALIDGSLTPAEYEKIALKAHGKSSVGMQILGGIMIALAMIMATLVIATAPVTLPVVFPVVAGALVAYTGTMFGASVIAEGSRRSLSATMHNLGNNVGEARDLEEEDYRMLEAAKV